MAKVFPIELPGFRNIEFSEQQKQILDSITSFIKESDDRICILKGKAGTGKTTLISGIIDRLKSSGVDYYLSAPTGRASKILREKTGEDAVTIHKMIYSYRPDAVDEEDSGIYSIKFNLRKFQGKKNTVFIIDESSMISDDESSGGVYKFGSGKLLCDLLEFTGVHNSRLSTKIIFAGDEAQLPPVGSDFSCALSPEFFKINYGINVEEFELTENFRQSVTGTIMENSLKIREVISDDIKFDKLVKADDFIETDEASLKEIFDGIDLNHPDFPLIITYKNANVTLFNELVRETILNFNEPICSGDKVIICSNYYGEEKEIYNGETGIIRELSDETISRTVRFKVKNKETAETIKICFRKAFIDFSFIKGEFYFLEDFLYSNYSDISQLMKTALYVDFANRHKTLKKGSREFISGLLADPYFNALRIKPAYAITGHKAQGGEWNNVVIDFRSPIGHDNLSYLRWVYTAITRARKKIYALNCPFFEIREKSKKKKKKKAPKNETSGASYLDKKYGSI